MPRASSFWDPSEGLPAPLDFFPAESYCSLIDAHDSDHSVIISSRKMSTSSDRLVLIVRPDRQELLEVFAAVPGLVGMVAQVDRRQRHDRRHDRRSGVATERRHQDRRTRRWVTEALETQGFVVVQA